MSLTCLSSAPPPPCCSPALPLSRPQRGTDKQSDIGGSKVGPEHYYPEIDRWSQAHPNAPIFVATDDKNFLRALRQMYGSRLIVRDALRSDKNVFLDTTIRDDYRKGEDVLIDMLLLAKCSFLLKSSSAVGEFATYFNPALHEKSIDLQYSRIAPTTAELAYAAEAGNLRRQRDEQVRRAAAAVNESLRLQAVPLARQPQPWGQVGAGTSAAATSESVATAAAAAASHETPLETVLSFLVCNTSVCEYGRHCQGHVALCRTGGGGSRRRSRAQELLTLHLAERLRPLVQVATSHLAMMAAEMAIRPGMANPQPVDMSPASVMARIDERSDVARALEPDATKKATVDVVIVRCDEPVNHWLPKLVTKFPHDVTLTFSIAEMCKHKCGRAGLLKRGRLPPGASPGLVEACESPKVHAMLGAKVQHLTYDNWGFESAAYLRYILDNYDQLASSTLFIQAEWQPHAPKLLESNLLEHHMSTSNFSMWSPLYEMLPQKGCTDWCLMGQVWKHILPERAEGFADAGFVGNGAYGLFHAKREAIEARSLAHWQLAYDALMGRNEQLNSDLCKPLDGFGFNMSALMGTQYGKDMLQLIRGNMRKIDDPTALDTPKMLNRLGTWLDMEVGEGHADVVRTRRERLESEAASLGVHSPLCHGNKHVTHCAPGFTLDQKACDLDVMISKENPFNSKPCCEMHAGGEFDQSLLSLNTRIFYCAATTKQDAGKLMGTAFEHGWHMLMGEPPVLPLAKMPLAGSNPSDPPAFTACKPKPDRPVTGMATQLHAHHVHTRNVLHRLVKAGLVVMQRALHNDGSTQSQSLQLAATESLISKACSPIEMATRALMHSTDLCHAGFITCPAHFTHTIDLYARLAQCAPPSAARLRRAQALYGTFRASFSRLAHAVPEPQRPAMSKASSLAARKVEDEGVGGSVDLVISRCHGGVLERLPDLLEQLDHRVSVRTFIYERCAEGFKLGSTPEGGTTGGGSDEGSSSTDGGAAADGSTGGSAGHDPPVSLLPEALDQRDWLFAARRLAVAPRNRHAKLVQLHDVGSGLELGIAAAPWTPKSFRLHLRETSFARCLTPEGTCSREALEACLSKETRAAAGGLLSADAAALPPWLLETEREEARDPVRGAGCREAMPTARALGAVSALVASVARIWEKEEEPADDEADAAALGDGEKGRSNSSRIGQKSSGTVVQRRGRSSSSGGGGGGANANLVSRQSHGPRPVLGVPLACLESDFMMHNREMTSVTPLDHTVCEASKLAALPPLRMASSRTPGTLSPAPRRVVRTTTLAAGWFSSVMGLVKPVMHALETGAALQTPSLETFTGFTADAPCEARDLSCFFSSFGADSAKQGAEGELALDDVDIADPNGIINDVSRARHPDLAFVPPPYRARGWFWWASKVSELILQPSASLVAHTANVSAAIGLDDALGRGVSGGVDGGGVNGGGGGAGSSAPVLGMHVRQGDACSSAETQRMARTCSNLSTYVEAAMPMIRSAGVKVVYLATDSQQVIEDTRMFPHLRFIHMNTTRDPPGARLWDLRVRGIRPGQHPHAETTDEKASRLAANHRVARDATVDAMLLSRADILVGKFTSNLFRTAYSLAAARCDCVVPFVSLDAPWCFDYGQRVGANWEFPASGDALGKTRADNKFWC